MANQWLSSQAQGESYISLVINATILKTFITCEHIGYATSTTLAAGCLVEQKISMSLYNNGAIPDVMAVALLCICY